MEPPRRRRHRASIEPPPGRKREHAVMHEAQLFNHHCLHLFAVRCLYVFDVVTANYFHEVCLCIHHIVNDLLNLIAERNSYWIKLR